MASGVLDTMLSGCVGWRAGQVGLGGRVHTKLDAVGFGGALGNR